MRGDTRLPGAVAAAEETNYLLDLSVSECAVRGLPGAVAAREDSATTSNSGVA